MGDVAEAVTGVVGSVLEDVTGFSRSSERSSGRSSRASIIDTAIDACWSVAWSVGKAFFSWLG